MKTSARILAVALCLSVAAAPAARGQAVYEVSASTRTAPGPAKTAEVKPQRQWVWWALGAAVVAGIVAAVAASSKGGGGGGGGGKGGY